MEDDVERASGDIGGKHMLCHDGHVGLDEDAAIEAGNRRPQRQRLDQHRHAARRPAAGDRKGNARGLERLHGRAARGVSTFSAVTRVPSTSARTSEIFDAARAGSIMRDPCPGHLKLAHSNDRRRG